jgi:hypothetical protein
MATRRLRVDARTVAISSGVVDLDGQRSGMGIGTTLWYRCRAGLARARKRFETLIAIFCPLGSRLDPTLEGVMPRVSERKLRSVDRSNTALVEDCRELDSLGYLELREHYESRTHEAKLDKVVVLRVTSEGEEELAVIRARRGGSL